MDYVRFFDDGIDFKVTLDVIDYSKLKSDSYGFLTTKKFTLRLWWNISFKCTKEVVRFDGEL